MYKDIEKYNKYQAKYHLERYHRIRNFTIESLGGVCVECGSKENLELDHIDPKTKLFTSEKLLNVSKKKWDKEVKKLQVLCKVCHNIKTIKENGKILVKGMNTHGTLSSYRYCRCSVCKKAKSEYMKKYHETHTRKR